MIPPKKILSSISFNLGPDWKVWQLRSRDKIKNIKKCAPGDM